MLFSHKKGNSAICNMFDTYKGTSNILSEINQRKKI